MNNYKKLFVHRMSIASLFALFVLVVSGCKEESNLPSINVSDLSGVQISEISDQNQLQAILSSWKTKEEVKLKKTPDFDVVVSFDNEGKLESWLYAKSGFAKLNSKKDSRIYRVNLEAVNSLVK